MKRPLASALAVLLASVLYASAQTVGKSASAGPVAPATAEAWAASIRAGFASGDPGRIQPVLASLLALPAGAPEIQASLQPVRAELRAAVETYARAAASPEASAPSLRKMALVMATFDRPEVIAQLGDGAHAQARQASTVYQERYGSLLTAQLRKVSAAWDRLEAGAVPSAVAAPAGPADENGFARRRARLAKAPARGEALTVGRPLDDEKTITVPEWFYWKEAEWSERRGKRLRFADESLKTVDQEVLALEDFDLPTRRLITGIKALSFKPKFSRRDYAMKWSKTYEYYAGLLSRNKEIHISDPELREHVNEQTKFRSVEIGFWRVTLDNDRVLAATHSSSKNARIENPDFLAALNKLLDSNGIRQHEIAKLQYFHTHPGSGPLSHGDWEVFGGLNEYFLKEGLRIPIHIYAVSSVGERLLIFHAGEARGQ